MYLYLVRHGQSDGNERQLFFGSSDHPLTQLGREQARQAADKLREVSFTRCVSSDLARCWDTAELCLQGRNVAAEPWRTSPGPRRKSCAVPWWGGC